MMGITRVGLGLSPGPDTAWGVSSLLNSCTWMFRLYITLTVNKINKIKQSYDLTYNPLPPDTSIKMISEPTVISPWKLWPIDFTKLWSFDQFSKFMQTLSL